jgi:hypothetical protein
MLVSGFFFMLFKSFSFAQGIEEIAHHPYKKGKNQELE